MERLLVEENLSSNGEKKRQTQGVGLPAF